MKAAKGDPAGAPKPPKTCSTVLKRTLIGRPLRPYPGGGAAPALSAWLSSQQGLDFEMNGRQA